MKNIFLSASIPLPEKGSIYYATADILAIREAVIALTTTVLPSFRLIWGGHPSITPLINYVMQKKGLDIKNHVKLYQSLFFENDFPQENAGFENIVLIEGSNGREQSVDVLRENIFENDFSAGVFIGGMSGVVDEYKIFANRFPEATIVVLASTGGAAKIIYNEFLDEKFKNVRFEKDYGYMSLFQNKIIDKQ